MQVRALRTVGTTLLLLLALLLARAQAASTPEPLRIAPPGAGLVNLTGPWLLHLGDDPANASPTLDDSGWEAISPLHPWGMQGHFNYTGYAWYRLHLQPQADSPGPYSLLFGNVDDVSEIFWNGRRIGAIGTMPPHAWWYYAQPPTMIPLGALEPGVLAIRVWKAPPATTDSGLLGGLETEPVLGSPRAISALRSRRLYDSLTAQLYTYAVGLLLSVIGFVALFSWLRYRDRMQLLWLALFAFASTFILVSTPNSYSLGYSILVGLLSPVSALRDIAVWLLLVQLFGLARHPFIRRWLHPIIALAVVVNLADCLVILLDWSGPHAHALQVADGTLTLVNTALQATPFVLLALSLRKRLSVTAWVVALCTLLYEMVTVLAQASVQFQRFTHWTFGNVFFQPLFQVAGTSLTVDSLLTTFFFFAILLAAFQLSRQQAERHRQLQAEFHSAQQVQQLLIPDSLPQLPGYRITSTYRPAQEVGGDFFQVIPQTAVAGRDCDALVILGDVSGKGLPAAMTVSLIVGTIRALAETITSPTELLAALNRRLYRRVQGGFTTCLVLRLCPDGSCELASAGHPAPFLNAHELTLPPELPLGLVPEADFSRTHLKLAPGDTLTLYTDGLLEARGPHGELFGFDRVAALLAGQPTAQQAGEAAVAFGQDDDITVLILTRTTA